MTAQEAKQRLGRVWKDYTSAYDTVPIEDLLAFDMATNALGAIDQIQWERDMAIKQLHDLGYGLGEKPREDNSSSDKLIKASDAVDVVAKHSALYGNGEISTDEGETLLYDIMSEITNLPSSQPNLQPTCNQLATDCISRAEAIDAVQNGMCIFYDCDVIRNLKALPSAQPERKYEYHIDHTDCIWRTDEDSKCPSTCSQYRDGWNDAMDYIFRNGKGYQPYKRKAK